MAKLKQDPAAEPVAQKATRTRTPGVAVSDAVPELGGHVNGAAPPPLGERPPFYICVHPHRWSVICGRVVPNIKRLRAVPGANNTDRTRDGKPDMAGALEQMRARGWQVLDWDVDGRGTSYLRRIDSTGGWVDRWTTVFSGTEAERVDEQGFVDWLASLVEHGVIPQCPSFVLDKLRAQTQSRLDKTLERNRPEDALRIKRLQADIAAIDAELDQLDPVPVAATNSTPEAELA